MTSIVATGAKLDVAASFIEQKADITPVAAMLAVAVPVVVFLVLLHALHYFLVRRFRSTDAWLLISSIGVGTISVIAALSGISTAACLVLLAFAPAVTIVVHELADISVRQRPWRIEKSPAVLAGTHPRSSPWYA